MEAEQERMLSPREQEQLEALGDKMKMKRDKADERWPEIVIAAALAKDCQKALVKEGFPEGQALQLVPALLKFLK
jgi:hypothetical protein